MLRLWVTAQWCLASSVRYYLDSTAAVASIWSSGRQVPLPGPETTEAWVRSRIVLVQVQRKNAGRVGWHLDPSMRKSHYQVRSNYQPSGAGHGSEAALRTYS